MKSNREKLLLLNYLVNMIAAARLDAIGKTKESNELFEKAELIAKSLKMNNNEVLELADNLLNEYL